MWPYGPPDQKKETKLDNRRQTALLGAKWLTRVAASVVSMLAITQTANAADFPEKPIRWIVPWGPGSTTDTLARLVSVELSKTLKVPVIVENKAGADGNIGAAYVASSRPDGYVLMLGTTSTNAVNVVMQQNLSYDPQKDFRAVAKLASIPNLLVVGNEIPATNVSELIALAKQKPYTFASTGAGGTVHLSGELFKKMAHVDMLHVPYKAGTTLLPDLITGRVEMMFCNVPLCISQIKAGKLKALGVTSAARSQAFPDVPTIAEQGIPGFDVVGWYGVFVPAGVPDAVVNKLNAAFNHALQAPDVATALNDMGANVNLVTPQAMDAFTAGERSRWTKLIDEMGLK